LKKDANHIFDSIFIVAKEIDKKLKLKNK